MNILQHYQGRSLFLVGFFQSCGRAVGGVGDLIELFLLLKQSLVVLLMILQLLAMKLLEIMLQLRNLMVKLLNLSRVLHVALCTAM